MMFEQTFVPPADAARKPFSLGLSLVVQAAALAILALLPLLDTSGLPALQLRSLLVAPPPPVRPSVVPQSVTVHHVFSARPLLFHPDTVNRVAPVTPQAIEIGPAPTVAVDGALGEPNSFGTSLFNGTNSIPAPPPPPLAQEPKRVEPRAVRMTSGVAEANLLQKVQPVYPPLARTARVSGTVEFSATISKQGLIENLQLVRGHPLLVNAAKDAILQWRYKPTVLNGQPVDVVTTILVTFHLN